MKRFNAFTLSEVMITVGILGIVAAFTLPTLLNTNKSKALETQFKKAYSVLYQANRMLVAQEIMPYEEFVLSLQGASSSDSQPEPAPEPEEPEVSDTPDSGSDGDETPDNSTNSDATTKELTEQFIQNGMQCMASLFLDSESCGKASDAFNQLADRYGYTNWQDYFNDLKQDIKNEQNQENSSGDSDSSDSGNDSNNTTDEDSSSNTGNNNSNNNNNNNNNETDEEESENSRPGSNRPGGNRGDRESFLYRHYFANIVATNNSGEETEESSLFVTVKTRQLALLKKNLSGAKYCTNYQTCGDTTVEYLTLDGSAPAEIEAAMFENSALQLNNGSIIWLGNADHPERYYVDTNGVKGPNRLGVDLFTFSITPKDTIATDTSEDCTLTETPPSGDGYRGYGCSGPAALDLSPDDSQKGYWKTIMKNK